VAASAKFTRIPKTENLIARGVPAEVIPTYCALSDYANNRTGECFPKMETLAKTLERSVRTIQRHLHLLKELGLIEFVERRRHKGRFSSYLYKIVFLAATTGHARRVGSRGPIYRRTKRSVTPPNSPPETKEEKRARDARRRREGYEWLFDR
jgi:hypothetical protein